MKKGNESKAVSSRLNRINFASADIASNTQEVQPDYTTVQENQYIVRIERRIDRTEGWQDVEIMELQKDKSGLFPPRFKCQIAGNESPSACFYLTMSNTSKLKIALENAGILPSGQDFDIKSLVGKKFQMLFSLDMLTINGQEKQCFTVVEVQEFIL